MAISELTLRQISDYMEKHRDEMVNDILSLCRIDSEKQPYRQGQPFGSGLAEVLSMAISIADGYGFSINNIDNYIGTVDINEKESRMDILVHLDVVPGGDGWTVTEPFSPLVKDGRIYGRGSQDDKGPAVAALYAMRCVRDLGLPLSAGVRLILGTDEETTFQDIRHYYEFAEEAPVSVAMCSSFPLVNCEKGQFRPVFRRDCEGDNPMPGILSIESGSRPNVIPDRAEAVVGGLDDNLIRDEGKKVTAETGVSFEIIGDEGNLRLIAHGVAAHGSTPEKGKNALTALLLLLSRLPLASSERTETVKMLTRLFPYGDRTGKALGIEHKDRDFGDTTGALTIASFTEDDIAFGFDVRYPMGGRENIVEKLKKKMAAEGFDYSYGRTVEPHYVDPDTPLIKTLLGAYEAVTKKKGSCVTSGISTYAHVLKNGVAFGALLPGADSREHGADECVSINDLITAAKIYAAAIVEICR